MRTLKKGEVLRKVGMAARVVLPALVVVGVLVAVKWRVLDDVTPQSLTEFFENFGAWAPVVFLGVLALRPMALLPGQVLCAVGGLVFGTALGSVYALIGSFLSTTLLYFVARGLGTRPMQRVLGHRYGAVARLAKHHDFQLAAVCTLNPLLPTDVTIVGGAAAGARYWQTVGGVLLGTLPGTVITAHFGAALKQGNTAMTIAAAVGLTASLVLGTLFGRRIAHELQAERPVEAVGPAPFEAPEQRRQPVRAPRAIPRPTT